MLVFVGPVMNAMIMLILQYPKLPGVQAYAIVRRRPSKFNDFVVYAMICNVNDSPHWHEKEIRLPHSYREAMNSPQHAEWREGMEKEMQAMKDKDVLELVPEDEVPDGKTLLRTMWRFQVKTDNLGCVTRFRPRLVACGNSQKAGIDFDFDEIFSPVARMASFRLLVALCVNLGLTPWQCDINTAYLNAALKIVQYVRWIAGFPCQKGHVYRVNQALYGLHQSGREWNMELRNWLVNKGFSLCTTEPCLYFYRSGTILVLLMIYVDDVICATNCENFKVTLFNDLNEKYGIKDLGLLHEYLGVEIVMNKQGAFIQQKKYCEHLLERFGMADAHGCRSPMETNIRIDPAKDDGNDEPQFAYRSAVGALMYLATSTRPDIAFARSRQRNCNIAFAVGYLSRFVEKPTTKLCGMVKRLMRYLVMTIDKGILYKRPDSTQTRLTLNGYCDSDWGNCPQTRKSVTGYTIMLAGGAISWAARRQSVVAQSTAEAEYVASCEATMDGKGILNILWELFPEYPTEFHLGIDNKAALALATNPTYNRKTRHIELRWHFVREEAEKGVVNLFKVAGTENSTSFEKKQKKELSISLRLQALKTPPTY
ncbi:LOW QUALITY PROTEIN: Integrase, catalytic core protein [Phytophthora megakarya]|uniref:Integrase, catalytic core protein n=1 Tax=Phytophthora megakarya TaxID=4795 RepID=A0A225VXC2_9STRA|nr:LOW QUALITY PROTEIN: Integrase, catalytic core protein [Phytophthora megakarya]